MEHAFIKQSFRGKYNFMTRKMLAAIKKINWTSHLLWLFFERDTASDILVQNK